MTPAASGVRLAGHTYAFRDLPLEQALDGLVVLGFRLVEVWLGHASDGPGAVARALDARGLSAVAVSAGGFYRSGGPAPERAFGLAAEIGAPAVVACVAPALLDTVTRRLPEGLTLCVENHWDQPVATPREAARAVAPHPRLGACLDTGHAILAGVRPERYVAGLGARLRHVHLKDARGLTPAERILGRRLRRRLLPRPAPVFPGTGRLDVDRLRRALEGRGYDGVVTLEHEGAEPARALAELLARWRSAA